AAAGGFVLLLQMPTWTLAACAGLIALLGALLQVLNLRRQRAWPRTAQPETNHRPSWRCKLELRHLRCFVAVAEELHFARAAERLHMEQSPLSRTIKDLEYRLGVQLFERTTRRTRLTWAGTVLLQEAQRVIAVVEQ